MEETNKLILIGNGFDLAHGLKTSYKDYLDWYLSKAFQQSISNNKYNDSLIEIDNIFIGMNIHYTTLPKTMEEVLNFFKGNSPQKIKYNSPFFQSIINSLKSKNWVDIEYYYYKQLKQYFFSETSYNNKIKMVRELNNQFNCIINELSEYIKYVNSTIKDVSPLEIKQGSKNLSIAFERAKKGQEIKFLNFNYTETLVAKKYAKEDDIIYIHGRAADLINNPIIFGYGDESDPVYQNIEDSGENIYLEHIKSFGYFQTENYHKVLNYIDSAPFTAFIVGHSCGLSDRILLNEIFEHPNCKAIEIFFYETKSGTNNFRDITFEISRHFKPNNKNMMRRKVGHKNIKNIIPQNPNV
ncbi:AbiH family protein [Limnovirga soli]|uniref:Bacteriophage abortive infection AbiH n=1 Tax=Limnovirga soli TaxID=2656915 RepID=A0A8J8JSD5_9BACT|nr:AbiH family protein [Limnovirga soli]NNV53960.1 hypothetical protein [Limnovirga soli]